jgi:hypothetical protein
MTTGMQILDRSSATRRFKLGDYFEQNGNGYRYIQFTTVLGKSDFAYLDANWKTVELVTSGATEVAVAGSVQYEVTEASEYGWIQTKGDFIGNVASGLGAGDKLYTSSTAGRLGADSSSILVEGVTLTTASTSDGDNACRAVQEMVINCQDDS